MDSKKRKFIFFALALTTVNLLPSTHAFAKDGEDDGGGSGSGEDDSHDDDGESDHGDDNDDDEDEGGTIGRSGHGGRRKEQDRALKAVATGKAVSLTKLQKFLAENYAGRLLHVGLVRRLGSYVYEVRILADGNRVINLRLDALTLQRRLF